MGSSLRSFIKDVRNAKTLSEERTLITKQSAKIRTKLRDDHISSSKRRVNIQKMLYLYILGEKTHFGQVECINLIASDNFIDKRLGYLATMLLLDEKQDLLTLLTNLLSNDLVHPNKFIVSMALSTLGSLSSIDLARDLYPDVVNLLQNSTDPFILKKTLQCLAKLIIKDTDFTLLEIFPLEIILDKFLNNRNVFNLSTNNHGIWFGICKLVQSIMINLNEFFTLNDNKNDNDKEINLEFITNINENILKIIPNLLNKLSQLNLKNLEPNYDVQGIQDPFLQCELINTLKWIFKISFTRFDNIVAKYLDKFNDLLTQVATNSNADLNKNASNAILYEITRTIFELNLNQSLRVLGINLLANFLKVNSVSSNSKRKINNNIKYVALDTLIKVADVEPTAIDKHKKFISYCLYDNDISIKFRALELTFAIMNDENLIDLTNDLLNFLNKISTKNVEYTYSSYIDLDDVKELIFYTVNNLIAKEILYSMKEESVKLKNMLQVVQIVGNIISIDKINDFLIIINNIENWNDKIKIINEFLMTSFQDTNPNENIGFDLIIIWCLGEYTDLILNVGSVDKNVLNDRSITKKLMDLDKKYYDNQYMIQYILTSVLKISCKINDTSCIEALRQIILEHSRDSHLITQIKCRQYETIFMQPVEVKRKLLSCMPKFVKKEVNLDNDIIEPKNANNTNKGGDLLLDLLSDINTSDNQTTTRDGLNVITVPSSSKLVFDNESLRMYTNVISVVDGNATMELYYENKDAMNSISDIHVMCAVPKTQKLVMGQLQPVKDNNLEVNGIKRQILKVSGSGKLKFRVKLAFTVFNEVKENQFEFKLDETI